MINVIRYGVAVPKSDNKHYFRIVCRYCKTIFEFEDADLKMSSIYPGLESILCPLCRRAYRLSDPEVEVISKEQYLENKQKFDH